MPDFPATAKPSLTKAKYQLEIAGTGEVLGVWLEAKLPAMKVKMTKVQPAGNAVEAKFPSGLAEVDDIECTRYLATDGAADKALRDWQALGFNARGRTPVPPQDALRDMTVLAMDIDGNVVHEWLCHNCYPMELGALEFKGGEPEALTAATKFSTTWIEQIR